MDAKLKIIEDKYEIIIENLNKGAQILKRKAQEEQDIVYWVDYGFDVGYNHLSSNHYATMSQFKYW